MDTTLWGITTWSKSYAPGYTCPHCKKAELSMDTKSMAFEETPASKSLHGSEDWDPYQVEFLFTCWLRCRDRKCGQSIAVCGVGGVEQSYDGDGGVDWVEEFYPRFMQPTPDIIDVRQSVPVTVAADLRAAFSFFLSDSGACANRIRSAIEGVLDEIGIQRRVRTKAGNFDALSLHKRLALLAISEPTIGANLLAVKWLGNTGSHGGRIDRSDLLDAFAIIEHTLAEVFDQRSRNVAALAKKMTRKHKKRR